MFFKDLWLKWFFFFLMGRGRRQHKLVSESSFHFTETQSQSFWKNWTSPNVLIKLQLRIMAFTSQPIRNHPGEGVLFCFVFLKAEVGLFICISWCLSFSRGRQEQPLFLYILVLLGDKPFSHRISRNKYLEVVWKKKHQVSQVTVDMTWTHS